jgi:hypothetical protein
LGWEGASAPLLSVFLKESILFCDKGKDARAKKIYTRLDIVLAIPDGVRGTSFPFLIPQRRLCVLQLDTAVEENIVFVFNARFDRFLFAASCLR